MGNFWNFSPRHHPRHVFPTRPPLSKLSHAAKQLSQSAGGRPKAVRRSQRHMKLASMWRRLGAAARSAPPAVSLPRRGSAPSPSRTLRTSREIISPASGGTGFVQPQCQRHHSLTPTLRLANRRKCLISPASKVATRQRNADHPQTLCHNLRPSLLQAPRMGSTPWLLAVPGKNQRRLHLECANPRAIHKVIIPQGGKRGLAARPECSPHLREGRASSRPPPRFQPHAPGGGHPRSASPKAAEASNDVPDICRSSLKTFYKIFCCNILNFMGGGGGG